MKGQRGYFSHFIPDGGKDVFVEIAEFNKDFTYVDAGMRFNKWVKGKEIFRLIFANYRVDRKFPPDKGAQKDVQLEKVRKKYEDMIYHQVALFFEMEELLGYFNLKHIIEILRSHDPSKELMDKIKALAFNPKNKDLLKEYDVINTINTLKTYHEVAINHDLLDFTMPSSIEDSVSTFDYRGKYLLIDFWGSHCAPCIKKNKVIAEKFGQLQIHNVDVLGVFIDYSNKPMEASHFKKSQKHFEPYPWKQVFMFKGKDSEEVVDFYQAYLVPKTVLVSPSGKILAVDIETVEEILEIVNQPQN